MGLEEDARRIAQRQKSFDELNRTKYASWPVHSESAREFAALCKRLNIRPMRLFERVPKTGLFGKGRTVEFQRGHGWGVEDIASSADFPRSFAVTTAGIIIGTMTSDASVTKDRTRSRGVFQVNTTDSIEAAQNEDSWQRIFTEVAARVLRSEDPSL